MRVKRKTKRSVTNKNAYARLVREYKKAAKIANQKLESLEAAGLREFNMQMLRKWDIMLKDSTVKFVNTRTGKFMASPSSSANRWMSAGELRRAIGTLTQFSSSRFTSVEYTRAYVEENKARLGISDEKLLSEVFRVFREFGFEGRYDSNNIISNIAEWHDRTGRRDMANVLQDFIDEYNANMTADSNPMDTDMLAGKISDLVANIDSEEPEDYMLSGAEMDEIARLRSLEAMNEPDVELVDKPTLWDDF